MKKRPKNAPRPRPKTLPFASPLPESRPPESPPPSPSPPPPEPLAESPPPAPGSGGIDPAAVASAAGFDAAAGVGHVEPPPPGEVEAPAVSDGSEAPPLEFDAWYQFVHAGFGAVSAVTKLKSLAFDAADEKAQGAFRALYDTCAEIPSLNFMLRPAGKWGLRVMLVGAFALPMARAVKAERIAQRGGAVPGAAKGAAAVQAEEPAAAGPLPASFMDQMKAEGARLN